MQFTLTHVTTMTRETWVEQQPPGDHQSVNNLTTQFTSLPLQDSQNPLSLSEKTSHKCSFYRTGSLE